MPLFEDGSYSSYAGAALVAKVLAGRCDMQYTRVAIGSGYMEEGDNPKSLSTVAGYVMDGKIANVTNPVNGECQVTVQINSDDVEEGFYCTGILLYAQDPDDGEIPYTYLVLENGPEWIRPKSSVVGKLATFDLVAAVGEIDRVMAALDPDSIVTRDTVEQLIEGSVIKRDLTIPSEGWETTDVLEEVVQVGYGNKYVDIAQKDINENHIANITIYPIDIKKANDCGLLPLSCCVEGAIRFYAKQAPESELKACAMIFRPGIGFAPSGPIRPYDLPIATRDTPGIVMIGDGIDVTEEGLISADASEAVKKQIATQEEIDALLAEIE